MDGWLVVIEYSFVRIVIREKLRAFPIFISFPAKLRLAIMQLMFNYKISKASFTFGSWAFIILIWQWRNMGKNVTFNNLRYSRNISSHHSMKVRTTPFLELHTFCIP
ncbi:unnamed protein product [Meloidogyne enterolobii]|uniref:Uncharacterized protein n=1 Tax=Meloidogyne enterolobii TaxID=390850 RepID=A0ACB0YFA0_MELEN